MANATPILNARFWSKVEVGSAGQCWNWRATKNAKGYGNFYGQFDDNKAHRVAYRLFNGAIPDGMCVLHKCDNPACVNPAHLFLGTIADNNRDCREKGRNVVIKGERHHNSKLSDEQVAEIRSSPARGVDLARRFGVSQATISDIRSFKQRV